LSLIDGVGKKPRWDVRKWYYLQILNPRFQGETDFKGKLPTGKKKRGEKKVKTGLWGIDEGS